MNALIGAILILAGSVLVGAGIVADSFSRGQGSGFAGYVLGAIIGFVGLAFLASGPVIRATMRADKDKSDSSPS